MKMETKVDVCSANEAGSLYDSSIKKIFTCKEILVPLLQLIVPEFKDCSQDKILQCLDVNSITNQRAVSDIGSAKAGTSYRITESSTEFESLNEKLIRFDVRFLVKNPMLSNENIEVMLHLDIEGQKSYRPRNPSYQVETRSIYYGARELSSQIGLVTNKTNYADLEKCYSIWICTEDIPQNLQNTVSMYSIEQTDIIGRTVIPKKAYDLISCIIIRRGKESEESETGIFDFLNGLFDGTISKIEKYSKIEWEDEFIEEVNTMTGYANTLYNRGHQKGFEDAVLRMLRKGMHPKEIAEILSITEEEVRKVANDNNIECED